jgi:S1-C subfamily serine protease
MKRMLALLMVFGMLALACSGFGIIAPTAAPADTPTPEATVTPSATATATAMPAVNLPAAIAGGLAELYERVNPGVVAIFAYGGSDSMDALGTGFVIDAEGHILTNMHVVSDAEEIEVDFPSGVMTEAEVVAEDADSDLAVLKVDVAAGELHPLVLGDSSLVRVGDPVVAIGNPYGLYNTLTLGIVSAKGRTDESLHAAGDSGYFLMGDMIQTDTAINPGNSGGPLLNLKGEVIGVNRSIRSESVTESGDVVNSGLGFAISSNIVRRVLPALLEKGRYDYPYLGLTGLSELHLKTLQALELPYGYGVYVTAVVAGGPADQAGLRAGTEAIPDTEDLLKGGDLIIAVDGQTVRNFAEMISIIVLTAEPGDTVPFTVYRDGGTVDIPVTLGVRSR